MAAQTTLYRSPIGDIELTYEDGVLVALRLTEGQNRLAVAEGSSWATQWLDQYFSGKKPKGATPIKPYGTPFQLRVWQELTMIPYGHTVTYGKLAQRIGCRSAQAVGQAVGSNPIAILIPCHRVVASNGLGGYAYGVDIKQKLLKIEQQ